MNKKLTLGCVSGALLICVALSFSTLAQVAGGTISGTVTDPEGKAVPNASIIISNPATGLKRNLVTNEDGIYSAPNLVPGNYEVTASSSGFKTTLEKVELKLGAETVLNLHLEVGDVSEKVVVAAEAPPIDQSGSTLIATVESKTIRELPLNGRDWTMLATLEPNVHSIDTQTVNTLGNTGRINRGWGTQLTVGGARPQQNNYRLDGVSINDYSGGGPGNTLGANLGVEAIQEYSVVSANPSGEYGKTSGGVFNATTRSGTNQVHGSGYEFIRNSALDARNFFDGAVAPPYRRNQFGFAIGGPVYLPRFGEDGSAIGYKGKNKTFFFANYEGLRESLSITSLNTVPSLAARAGQLTTGNITVNAKVAPYLNLFPLPNISQSGDTGIASVIQKNITGEDFFLTRVDHKFTDKDSMHGTIMRDTSQSTGPDNFNVLLQAMFSKRSLFTVEENHIFSPTLVNTARLGYSRVVALGPQTVSILNPNVGNTGLGFLPNNPVGTITIGGLSRFQGANATSSNFYYNSYQGYDDLFYTLGDHALKFGGAYELTQLNESGTSALNGVWTYGSLRNFLLNGAATSFSAQLLTQVVNPTYLRQSIFGFYAQDDWRARPNLSLNLGLRYEYATAATEKYGRLASLVNLTDATPKIGSPFYNNPSPWKSFSPRLGFSWDPFKNGKTAIRGGIGLYDALRQLYQSELSALLTSPFFRNAVVNSPGGSAGGLFPSGAVALLTNEKDRVSYVEQNPKRSYVMQWNLNVQRELPFKLVLQVGYVGSHGVHLPFKTQDADIVLPISTASGAYLWPTPRGSGVRLNTNVGQINGLAAQAYSLYNGANLRLSRRMHNGQIGVSYTWAKSIDNNSASIAGGQFTNSINGMPLQFPGLFRGLSDFDVRHSLILNYLWEVPGMKSNNEALRALMSGWQWGGIVRAQSGLPFSVTVSGDSLGLLSNNSFNFPDRVNSPACKNPVNPGNVTNYIKVECFVAPQLLPNPRLGNAGRNTLTGPGLLNFDMSLYKNNYIKRISENFNLQFRVEAFNIFNRANFRPPTGSAIQLYTYSTTPAATNGTFTPNSAAGILSITSTTSRQIQFALKAIF